VLGGRNNACKRKFYHKILAKIKFKTEDNVPEIIKNKTFFLGILQVNEERSLIQ
jgi:hypothetical protein